MEEDRKTLSYIETQIPKVHTLPEVDELITQFKALWASASEIVKQGKTNKLFSTKAFRDYLVRLKSTNPKLKKIYDTISKSSKMTSADDTALEDAVDIIPRITEPMTNVGSLRSYNLFKTMSWKVLDTYFKSNPDYLVNHHLDSFNQFIETGIRKIFVESNPLKYIESVPSSEVTYKNNILLFNGGKSGDRIYFGKPIVYNDDAVQYMYPNDARLHNTTYGITIHYDVEVEVYVYPPGADTPVVETSVIRGVYLGMFPIMVNSNLCVLSGMSPDVKYHMGECLHDHGGYFIIDGKEKVVIPEETFANNMIYVGYTPKDVYSHIAEVRSVSEDSSKPKRTVSVLLGSPSAGRYTIGGAILVNIPNVRKPIPLFIVMRALGVISDKDIINTCILDPKRYSHYTDLFYPSVYDARFIDTQFDAIQFIATFVKNKSVSVVLNILTNYFLPHVGETNFLQKAYYIGYMTKKLLAAYLKEEMLTDRDSFIFKRFNLSGNMLYDLFSEYYILQKKSILQSIDRTYNTDPDRYRRSFVDLLETGSLFYEARIVEIGFKKAFKGNWGSQAYTKKIGVVQDLNRLSWFTAICQLRKSTLPMPAGAKVTGPRKLHSTQWGYIDVLDCPEGADIGFTKHLAITTTITRGTPGSSFVDWMYSMFSVKRITDCTNEYLSITTKLFVNGTWIGNLTNPMEMVSTVKSYKHCGIIPIYTSVSFHHQTNEIHVYTDGGRMVRPVYYITNGVPSYSRKGVFEMSFTWSNIVSGFGVPKISTDLAKSDDIYIPTDLYADPSSEYLYKHRSLVEYVDVSEEDHSLIAMSNVSLPTTKWHTHIEIDPSTILGVMGNSIIFPQNNQLPRNNFSGAQSRQAVSIYSTNYNVRMDKTGLVLNYGTSPLVRSRYLTYLNNDQIPYGVNCVVAIMSYTGYNVEDGLIFNEGSLRRGLFKTSYYTTYEATEDYSEDPENQEEGHMVFSDILSKSVINTKPGCDYSKLDPTGLIRHGEQVDEKTMIIGRINVVPVGPPVDASIKPKKGQLGTVDKTCMLSRPNGRRIAKVRIREDRTPNIGDKFASRAGQKGTVGIVLPEKDMPFTMDGMKPDIIVNPHALPSRMTVGHLIETILGKCCAANGVHGDCTSFGTLGSNVETIGKQLQSSPETSVVKEYASQLQNIGYNSTGSQVLYNGMSGEQVKSDIFIGTNYYMRLKHMVKDKINYRAQGPKNFLTRQSVHGRANDGGLRIGEMERDSIITHGMSAFLQESFMLRADAYKLAVCNLTGLVAIYNPSTDVLISPNIDGPLKFVKDVNSNDLNITNIIRFGRSFSIVDIPYSFKLLLQELQVLGVQVRLLTDKNVDKFGSMSMSNNIINLTKSLDVYAELKKHKDAIETYVSEYTKHTK
jgi:DNA-directed RNA polymerase II subunit RPB2